MKCSDPQRNLRNNVLYVLSYDQTMIYNAMLVVAAEKIENLYV